MNSVAQKTKKYTHFTHEERLVLEFYYYGKSSFPKIQDTEELAEILGKSRRTIQRELKRGKVEHIKSGLEKVFEYNADYAQENANYEMTAKGAPLKIGCDLKVASQIAELILEKKYSPYAVVKELQLSFCEKTLYNYISKSVIPDVTIKELPNKGVKYKATNSKKRFSRAGCALRSISNRPETVNERKEFGHWEIDTVKSCADTTTACILTLTERVTRLEIVRKIPNAEKSTVVKELNKLEKDFGQEVFKKLFKSITADGGSEFMDFEGIEKSVYGDKRVDLYFAHPYSSFERGTNENHNKIIRRFYPKGTDFSNLTQENFNVVQNWMNHYPRRILNGSTPLKDAQKYLGENFQIPA